MDLKSNDYLDALIDRLRQNEEASTLLGWGLLPANTLPSLHNVSFQQWCTLVKTLITSTNKCLEHTKVLEYNLTAFDVIGGMSKRHALLLASETSLITLMLTLWKVCI